MTASKTSQKESLQPLPKRPAPPETEGPADTTGVRPVQASLIGIIGICVLGLIDMAFLTHLHWQVHSIPGFTGGFCPGAGGEHIDCDAVAASPYSLFLGVPVSFWGVLAYLALIAVAAWGLRAAGRGAPHRGASLGLLSVAAAGALVVSAVLSYISHRFIDSFCSLCALGYVFNIGIAIAVGVALYSLRVGPFEALKKDLLVMLERPGMSLPIGAGCVLTAALTLGLYPSPEAMAESGEAKQDGTELVSLRVPGGDPEIERVAVWEDAPYKGPCDAPVTIVEFTDYQCGFCRRAHVEMKKLLAPYEGQYRIMHRHYPLDGQCNPAVPRPGNGVSCAAALHAICARQQDLFWELNARLFTTRGRLSPLEIRRLAEEVGCDMDALDACLESDLPQQALARDTRDGAELGVRGTPTFFINGHKIVGIPHPNKLELIFRSVAEAS